MTVGPRKNARKTRGKPFSRGNSGRPAGSRNRVTVAIEELFADEGEMVARKVIERALGGDGLAQRLVLDRICPPRKGRVVEFDMPAVKTAADVVAALGAALQALGAGQLTPEETATIATALAVQRQSLEVADLERRIDLLEERTKDEEGDAP
jgi:hypothetical protein